MLKARLLGVVGIVAVVGGAAGMLTAQAPDKLAFEVASVKPNASGSEDRSVATPPGGRFVANNVSLRILIRLAYAIQNYQLVGGPDWVNSDFYDVQGKAPDSLMDSAGRMPDATIQQMVQRLLDDRFKLAVRHESRALPVYALRVARNDATLGPQLRRSAVDCDGLRERGVTPPPPAPGGPPVCSGRLAGGHMILNGFPLSHLALNLSTWVERFVVDETGLTGPFDYDLQWSVDHLPQFDAMGAPTRARTTPFDQSGPSLFTAIQEQLGLKLELTTGPVDVIVIDHVEHPTAD